MKLPTINARQVKKLHTISSVLGMDDIAYREMLDDNYGVKSCKELTEDEAELLIQDLEDIAVKQGKWKKSKRKYEDYRHRSAVFATPKQMRYIEVLWSGVSRADDQAGIERTLQQFLWNKFKVFRLAALERKQASIVIKILEKMRDEQKQQQRHQDTGVAQSINPGKENE